MVHELVRRLKAAGVGIFLISHDLPDVFALSDRLAVMKNGRLVGTYRTADLNEDEVLGMIIAGKQVTRVEQRHLQQIDAGGDSDAVVGGAGGEESSSDER